MLPVNTRRKTVRQTIGTTNDFFNRLEAEHAQHGAKDFIYRNVIVARQRSEGRNEAEDALDESNMSKHRE